MKFTWFFHLCPGRTCPTIFRISTGRPGFDPAQPGWYDPELGTNPLSSVSRQLEVRGGKGPSASNVQSAV